MVDSIIWFFRTTVKSVGILGHERVNIKLMSLGHKTRKVEYM